MSGFWTLKLSKSNKDKQSSAKNNGHNRRNRQDPEKLVRTLMSRALDDAQSIVDLVNSKAQKEAELAMTGTIDQTETEVIGEVEPAAESLEEQPEEIEETVEANPAEQYTFRQDIEETIPDAVDMDRNTLYSEDIELVINSPIEPAALSRLYNSLQMTPEIKILYTNGSWEKGTVITVSLEKPLPLLEIISDIQGLTVTTLKPRKREDSRVPSKALLGGEKKKIKRIDLKIKAR